MRFGQLVSLLACGCSAALAADEELAFEITVPREILLRPPIAAVESLIEAKIEPTKRELRFDDVFATEKWEQGFVLNARLPIDEAFVVRQEFRTGLQTETILGPELSAAYREALAVLEKTSAELRVSDALRLAASIEQRLITNNRVPFAEIMTYGTQAAWTPVKATTLKLQIEWQQRQEFATVATDQQSYRLLIEQELIPKTIKATAGASLAQLSQATPTEPDRIAQKLEMALQWLPREKTALTLGTELANSGSLEIKESTEHYTLKFQRELFARSNLELQAGYEQREQAASERLGETAAWNLGARSDFALSNEWAAGLGLRYRVKEETPLLPPVDELSLTLSLKGRF